jgi:hypothetical protein
VQRTSDAGEEIHLESLGRMVEGTGALTQTLVNQRQVPLTFALCTLTNVLLPLCNRVCSSCGI